MKTFKQFFLENLDDKTFQHLTDLVSKSRPSWDVNVFWNWKKAQIGLGPQMRGAVDVHSLYDPSIPLQDTAEQIVQAIESQVGRNYQPAVEPDHTSPNDPGYRAD